MDGVHHAIFAIKGTDGPRGLSLGGDGLLWASEMVPGSDSVDFREDEEDRGAAGEEILLCLIRGEELGDLRGEEVESEKKRVYVCVTEGDREKEGRWGRRERVV